MSSFTNKDWLELCREHECLTEIDTTVAVLKALKVPGPAIKVLLPIVVNGVRLAARQCVHELELAVETGTPEERRESYQLFIQSTFALPDGRRVRWGDATIEDHELRIAYLARMRDGINGTILRHQAAIDELRRTGKHSLAALAGAT